MLYVMAQQQPAPTTPKEHYDKYEKDLTSKQQELDAAKGAARNTSGQFRFSKSSPTYDIFSTTDVLLLQNIKLVTDNAKGDWWLDSIPAKWKQDVENSLAKLTNPGEITKLEQKMKDLTGLMDDADRKKIELDRIINS